MVYKIVVDPAANNDIHENIEWYNKKQAGLGLKFYKQIQDIIKTICKNPSAFSIRYKTVHTAVLKKFPFLVHYLIDHENKTIIIISVLHTSRNPKIWDNDEE